MSLASKIFNIIQGSWKITRRIQGTGYLNGYAIFDMNPNDQHELFYSENGIFVFDDGNSLEASKKYIYRLIDDDIYVYFNDKSSSVSSLSSSSSEETNVITSEITDSLFHKFGINHNFFATNQTNFQFKALHLCADDAYNVIYEFNLNKADEFTIAYDVKGPKKNYISHTHFQKKFIENNLNNKLY